MKQRVAHTGLLWSLPGSWGLKRDALVMLLLPGYILPQSIDLGEANREDAVSVLPGEIPHCPP